MLVVENQNLLRWSLKPNDENDNFNKIILEFTPLEFET